MTCNGFSYDTYALHALGLCHEPERDELVWHLGVGCDVCQESLRDAFNFWYLFACLPSNGILGSVPEPSPRLKVRIMAIVHPASSRPPIAWRWNPDRIAAGTLIVCGLGVTAWEMGKHSAQPLLQQALSQAKDERSLAERLTAENRDLRARAPLLPPASPAAPSTAAMTAALSSLSQELSDTRAKTASLDQALAAEHLQIGDLQRDIAGKTTQLEAVMRDRDEAARQLTDAQRTLAQSADRSAQQELQIVAFRTQLQELEGQISQYRRVIEIQQENLTQHVQLASMIQAPSLRFVPLRATEAGPNARGVALIAGSSSMVFYASNLPPLPGQRVYQLWLMRGRGPAIASAGIFAGRSGKDQPSVELRNSVLLAGVTALAVTDEPAGGSPLPTGHKFLVGTPQ